MVIDGVSGTFTLGNNPGLNLGLDYVADITPTSSLVFGAFYEGFTFGKSGNITVYDSGSYYTLMEPESNTKCFGFRVGLNFTP
jgi:hypothetical protein